MIENNIGAIGVKEQIQLPKSIDKAMPNGAASFGQWLNRSLAEVDQLQQTSDDAAQKLMTGENKDIHGTMIAMQKASIALDLAVEVRNKVISAYEEIKRMQF